MISFVLFPVRFYRKHLSRRKAAPCCRFLPTCSEYCIEAVEEWGIFIGLMLSLWRLLRCNPLCRGGYDPVPKRKKIKK
ncbi:MAG: membrane protein insertion efficiency factor YidD [Ruminococcaceae bacterium]|nr:membrane protein insertion efficiency factor YidD [Oscillospiraceae bacterium]